MLELLDEVLLLVESSIDRVGNTSQGLSNDLLHGNRLLLRQSSFHERFTELHDWPEDVVHKAQRALESSPLNVLATEVGFKVLTFPTG